jgi:hypothetical protein
MADISYFYQERKRLKDDEKKVPLNERNIGIRRLRRP